MMSASVTTFLICHGFVGAGYRSLISTSSRVTWNDVLLLFAASSSALLGMNLLQKVFFMVPVPVPVQVQYYSSCFLGL